jgi:predicted nuclease of predicted toxin-antitoxin system
MDRFLIDECLSADLVATAKARGYDADYVPHIGKAGWQDWNLVPYAVANDYIVVTLNRRDFLKQHAAIEFHPGLVILIPQAPENRGQHQAALFEKALDAYAAMNDDLVNKVMEVRADGSVHVREWNADEVTSTIRSGPDRWRPD